MSCDLIPGSLRSCPPDVTLLADHSVLLAIPAFAPALVVVGVVIYIARRDRRRGDDDDDDDDEAHSELPGSSDEDRAP